MGPRITPTLVTCVIPKKRHKKVAVVRAPHSAELEARLNENKRKASEGWKAWEKKNNETQARERAKRVAAAKKAAATRKQTCGLKPQPGKIIVRAHYRSNVRKKTSE